MQICIFIYTSERERVSSRQNTIQTLIKMNVWAGTMVKVFSVTKWIFVERSEDIWMEAEWIRGINNNNNKKCKRIQTHTYHLKIYL